jgi:hypothetical protein
MESITERESTMTTTSEGISWDRVKEAIHRDWEQTKHDLHVSGGHELNQSVTDTLQQAAGKEPIPGNDRPNRPKVIGTWGDAEMPIGFGYEAHQRYGAEHPVWNHHVEETLHAEWRRSRHATEREWGDVSGWVRHGYEYTPNP